MKKPVSLLVLMGLLVNCTYTPKYYAQYERGDVTTISSRVGDVVDVQERDKFDLFHGMEGFDSARFYDIGDGGYELEIVTKSGKYLVVNRDSLAVLVLRDYINRYEEVTERLEDFEAKWQIIDHDDLGLAITRHEIIRSKTPQVGSILGMACCLGGGLTVGLIAFVLTYSVSAGGSALPVITGVVGGGVLSGAVGFLYGYRWSESVTVRRIKEARKPRVME